MNPIHVVTEKENIAPLVIMPGDPLRAKYIAENFLNDAKLVNDIRNMFAFTGTYNGVKVTVMGSGMGCPSIGIYSYELYKFYDVKKIIRIGTSGAMHPNVNVFDIVLSKAAYSVSTFAYTWNKSTEHLIESSESLNNQIIDTAKEQNIPLQFGYTITTDIFDVYSSIDHIIDNCPVKDELLCAEMEAYALFHMANVTGNEAAMLATVVDSKYHPETVVTPEQRQNNLNQMIKLALDSIIK